MDIVAHSLWAGLGAVAAARRWPVSASQARAAVALAALPDIGHLIPIALWGLLGNGTWQALRSYAFATPGAEPWLPAGVQAWSHTMHCVMHSAVVASVVTMLAWFRWRWLLVPLAGWWSHIVIDVFTHSREYYPSPVFYPITDRGFDGIAWPTPWFMALNYAALGIAGLWLWRSSRTREASDPAPGKVDPLQGPATPKQ
tara:strand:- start:3183 stop:3779 length:597 start_codon:yes stop_codon:yes gene_type:complete